MCRQNHCCAVDYFALGVIGYEFMLGRVFYFLFNFLFRGLITVNQERTLEIRFLRSKFKLRNKKFLMDGLLKLQTLSIKYINLSNANKLKYSVCKENLQID